MPITNQHRTLIHTFATDTYLPWAELFLEGLRCCPWSDFAVRMDVFNLSESQKEYLRDIYHDLDIRDSGSGYQELAEQQGVSIDVVKHWSEEISQGITTETNFPFKLFISVDKRYRSLKKVIEEAREKGYEYVIHSDVDIYIRKPLDHVLRTMSNYDVGLYFRKAETNDRRKTLGAFLVFRLTDSTVKFIDCWMNEIDSVSKKERWRGFGQSTLYYATQKSKETRFADFSLIPGAPVYSKNFSKEAELWLNSNSIVSKKGKAGQELARRKSWDDIKSKLPRFPFETNRQMHLYRMRAHFDQLNNSIKRLLHF